MQKRDASIYIFWCDTARGCERETAAGMQKKTDITAIR